MLTCPQTFPILVKLTEMTSWRSQHPPTFFVFFQLADQGPAINEVDYFCWVFGGYQHL